MAEHLHWTAGQHKDTSQVQAAAARRVRRVIVKDDGAKTWVDREYTAALRLGAFGFPIPVLRDDAAHVSDRVRLKMGYCQSTSAQAYMVATRHPAPIEGREGAWRAAVAEWQEAPVGAGHALAVEAAVLGAAIDTIASGQIEPTTGLKTLAERCKRRRDQIRAMVVRVRSKDDPERDQSERSLKTGFATHAQYDGAVEACRTELSRRLPWPEDQIGQPLVRPQDHDRALLTLAAWLLERMRANKTVGQLNRLSQLDQAAPPGAFVALCERLASGDETAMVPGLPTKLRSSFEEGLRKLRMSLTEKEPKEGVAPTKQRRSAAYERRFEERLPSSSQAPELEATRGDSAKRRILFACHALGMCAAVGIPYWPVKDPRSLQRYHLLTRYALPAPVSALDISWLPGALEEAAARTNNELLDALGLAGDYRLPPMFDRSLNMVLNPSPIDMHPELALVRRAMWLAMEAIGDPVFWARSIADASADERQARLHKLRHLFRHMVESVYGKEQLDRVCDEAAPRANSLKRLFLVLSSDAPGNALALDLESLRTLKDANHG